MKKIILLLFWLAGFSATRAQENYYVTVVKGNIARADGAKITVGTKLALSDKLVFASKESLLILLHPSKGRFVISPANAPPTKDNKFMLLVKDYLQLHGENVRLSSRAIEESPISLTDYFTTDPVVNSKILVIDTLKVKLPATEFINADNNENFFFLQLVANKPVNHKLKTVGRTLIISRTDIIFNDSLYSSAAGPLNLGYLENFSKNKKTKLVSSIEPVFMTKEECNNIIRGIKNSLAGKPDNEILQEVYTQLYYGYGKPNEHIIEQLYLQLR